MGTLCRLLPVIVRPVSANPLPADDILRVAEYSFAEKLQNPCALIETSRLQFPESEQERRSTKRTVVKELKAKAILLKETAQTILRTNVLPDCSTLELPLVALVPSAESILNTDPIEVLRMFYTSLLNHTAHVYFICEQLQKHPSDESCNTADLLVSAKSLSAHMRELMCILRFSLIAIPEEVDEENDSYLSDSTSQILNEMLMDQPLCSRRSVRDCQTMTSTVKLLTELTTYLQGTELLKDEDPA
ncbi:uncharacterized protein [Parasteatoda tepidariorum]|nr:uncharacterized protein LOC107444933 isoform X2 [Parasteatoda tepidariorum]